ncbi:regulatory protein RecX [Rhizorhapis suberifaciens]|uniref:Regulatory protein RecX n=1 Tax=Rhizorhapis suberifaciens TaxID=13656 RepID=A0A840HT04_9SPHN|nr:RecX family transcriptional regulator [Rhizorhapis suberifaciens]MBB4641135.1 regulatory protein [Rhizorhapis suberifaciens]
MTRDYIKKQKPPLNSERLEQLALHYAGRYATTQAKLGAYLQRKIRECGWDGERAPDVVSLVARFADLRYVDDAAFAAMRTASLGRRGYGMRRVEEDLRAAGIAEDEREVARQQAAQERWRAAETFARKRRIGPFSTEAADRELQKKQIGAFLRAGHDFELARRFVSAQPGEVLTEE